MRTTVFFAGFFVGVFTTLAIELLPGGVGLDVQLVLIVLSLAAAVALLLPAWMEGRPVSDWEHRAFLLGRLHEAAITAEEGLARYILLRSDIADHESHQVAREALKAADFSRAAGREIAEKERAR